MTRFPVESLRSVDLVVPDLARAVDFYTRSWGLEVVEADAAHAWLRATGPDHHVLALQQGAAAAIRSMTFRLRPDGDLSAMAARIAAAGGRITQAPPAMPADPAGGACLEFDDPCGRHIRLVQHDRLHGRLADAADRPTRLAHVNINSPDVDADAAFLDRALGFGLTDRSAAMAFVRTNADHHCVVIAAAPHPTLNHVAFLQPGWEGVMRAAGRLADHGTPIAWGIGRHGPGDNVFAYFIDPFGIVVEHTAEVLQVDDDYRVGGPADWTWPPGRTDQWGIAPPKSAACKAAQLAIPFTPSPVPGGSA